MDRQQVLTLNLHTIPLLGMPLPRESPSWISAPASADCYVCVDIEALGSMIGQVGSTPRSTGDQMAAIGRPFGKLRVPWWQLTLADSGRVAPHFLRLPSRHENNNGFRPENPGRGSAGQDRLCKSEESTTVVADQAFWIFQFATRRQSNGPKPIVYNFLKF